MDLSQQNMNLKKSIPRINKKKLYHFTSNTTNQQVKTLTNHIPLHPTPQINISKHNIKKPQNQIMNLLCHVIVLVCPPPCRSPYPSTTTSCCCPHSSIIASRHHPCPFSCPPLPSKERVWVRNGQIKYLIVLFESFSIQICLQSYNSSSCA